MRPFHSTHQAADIACNQASAGRMLLTICGANKQFTVSRYMAGHNRGSEAAPKPPTAPCPCAKDPNVAALLACTLHMRAQYLLTFPAHLCLWIE